MLRERSIDPKSPMSAVKRSLSTLFRTLGGERHFAPSGVGLGFSNLGPLLIVRVRHSVRPSHPFRPLRSLLVQTSGSGMSHHCSTALPQVFRVGQRLKNDTKFLKRLLIKMGAGEFRGHAKHQAVFASLVGR